MCLPFEDAKAALGGTQARQARYGGPAARQALGKFRALVSEILEEMASGVPAVGKGR